jgi:hypothetical protein
LLLLIILQVCGSREWILPPEIDCTILVRARPNG